MYFHWMILLLLLQFIRYQHTLCFIHIESFQNPSKNRYYFHFTVEETKGKEEFGKDYRQYIGNITNAICSVLYIQFPSLQKHYEVEYRKA